jgi:hypothetical protein
LHRAAWILAVSLVALGVLGAADRKISFADDVQPIFQSSCWKCHGSGTHLSNLDLTSKDSASRVLAPGDLAKSRLYRLIAGLERPAMPMGGTLTPQQVETLRLWIDQGAPWESTGKYWAFEKPVAASGKSIDDFVKQALNARGLKPAPVADRRTLLRRAYLDLIGLPPTPAETDEFLNDRSPGAWEKLIDKLLASPRYGERWGRHWLDVARYADSNGFEHDFDRPNAWRYRDYVIRAFNQDKPFDTFLREQIAGDELPAVTPDSLIATGFLRNYAKVGFREKDNPENRFDYLDDMIGTIGRGVLGLTVQCARCHDHKFDPISQRDYYRMQASLFGYVEVDHPLTSREAAEAYEKKKTEIDTRIKLVRDDLRELERPYREKLLPAKYQRFPQNVQEAIATPENKRTPGQTLLAGQVIRTVSVSDAEINRVMKPEDTARKQILIAEIARIEKERPKPIPVAMGITDGDYRFTPDGPGDEPAPGKGVKEAALEGSFLHMGPGNYQPPPSYLLLRGDPNSRGPEMQPGFLSAIVYGNPPTALPPASGHTSGRRRALAEWLTSADNPLTARVMVNRIWHHHFGRGIVPTLDNFGKMGEMPSNPELLDWLAVEFRNRGWSIKQMHRLIMTSEAYKRASEFNDAADSEKDPQDHFLWRYPMQRLDAEIIRDSILAVSGGLNLEMFGKPVFPMLQTDLLKSMSNGIWKQSTDGPAVWRRSIYVYRKRGLPFPLLDIFDLPNQNISCGARNISTVPTQALMLLNDDFVIQQSQLFANRLREAAPDPEKQVDLAYRIALGRPPAEAELRMNLDFLKTRQLTDFTHVMLNLNEFLYLR